MDRFILTKLGYGDYKTGFELAKKDKLLVGKGEHGALDYKMRVKLDSNSLNKQVIKDLPMYFGNMGVGEEKWGVKYDCNLLVEITSNSEDILNYIKENVASFFVENSFGTRQTKGYGSFTVQLEDKKNAIPKLYFSVSGNINKVFEEIEWISKCMRGGINDCFGQKRLYFKSLMYAYAKSLNQQWEKKTIKQAFVNGEQITERKYTYKDCLGLSSVEKWKNQNMTIEKSCDAVDRLKSPIIFKPIEVTTNNWKIYIIYSEIPQDFYDSQFNVKKTSSNSALILSIDERFSVDSYLNFIFNNVVIEELFSEPKDGTENTNKKNRILAIFEELSNNYNNQ